MYNLKEAARALLYLQENGITEYDALAQESASASAAYNDLSSQIKAAESRMAAINDLQRHIWKLQPDAGSLAELQKIRL